MKFYGQNLRKRKRIAEYEDTKSSFFQNVFWVLHFPNKVSQIFLQSLSDFKCICLSSFHFLSKVLVDLFCRVIQATLRKKQKDEYCLGLVCSIFILNNIQYPLFLKNKRDVGYNQIGTVSYKYLCLILFDNLNYAKAFDIIQNYWDS